MVANDYAIILDRVTKSYRHYHRPLDRLWELTGGGMRHVERNSISDVSFRVGRGEVVGLIGKNGAGKSTLLKMIAGRLEPTAGKVQVNGTVSAILELGTGFHPDLTGRENVRVGGLCLGLTRSHVEREMENIIAFSELGDVIDMPFRTYSTGMQARLTFATAVTVDPDILIVDEALSVGDNKFQLKSFNRMRSFKDAGKTILLVTHSMSSVTSFCDRAILLDHGRILADGDPNWVTSVYHHLQFGDLDQSLPPRPAPVARNSRTTPDATFEDKAAGLGPAEARVKEVSATRTENSQANSDVVSCEPEPEPISGFSKPGEHAPLSTPLLLQRAMALPQMHDSRESYVAGVQKGYRYGDRRATIEGVCIVDDSGTVTRQLWPGQQYALVMDCKCHVDAASLYCGFLIRDLRGDTLFGADTTTAPPRGAERLERVRIGEVRRIAMQMTNWLSAGDYVVSGAITAEQGRQSDMWFDAFEFVVVQTPRLHTASRVNLEPRFFVDILDHSKTETIR